MIVAVWTVSLLICSPPLMGACNDEDDDDDNGCYDDGDDVDDNGDYDDWSVSSYDHHMCTTQ